MTLKICRTYLCCKIFQHCHFIDYFALTTISFLLYNAVNRERVEVHDSIVAEVDRRVDTIQKKIFKGVFDSLVNLVDSSQVEIDRYIDR